jgi:hypothetical protein
MRRSRDLPRLLEGRLKQDQTNLDISLLEGMIMMICKTRLNPSVPRTFKVSTRRKYPVPQGEFT